MPKQLNTSEGINLMNIQYAVVFGVVFSFSFYVNSGSSAHAKFAISNENITTFICLLFYLLIDWTRANFLQEKIDFTFYFLLFWTISIWSLCLVIIMSNSLSTWKYILFSAYIIFVSFYDGVLIKEKLIRELSQKNLVFLGYLAGITFFLGLLFLFCSLFPNSVVIANHVCSNPIFLSPTVAVLFLLLRGLLRTLLLFGEEAANT